MNKTSENDTVLRPIPWALPLRSGSDGFRGAPLKPDKQETDFYKKYLS